MEEKPKKTRVSKKTKITELITEPVIEEKKTRVKRTKDLS
jgi:hypothetical protein